MAIGRFTVAVQPPAELYTLIIEQPENDHHSSCIVLLLQFAFPLLAMPVIAPGAAHCVGVGNGSMLPLPSNFASAVELAGNVSAVARYMPLPVALASTFVWLFPAASDSENRCEKFRFARCVIAVPKLCMVW